MVWITRCCIGIGLVICFIVFKLITILIIAFRISIDDVSLVSSVFDFLFCAELMIQILFMPVSYLFVSLWATGSV